MSLQIKLRWKGRCPRHPRYNPESGEAGIKGNCQFCGILLNVFRSQVNLERQIELFDSAKRRGALPEEAA